MATLRMTRQITLPSGDTCEDRRMANGSSKLIWTIMVSACGLLVAGIVWWMLMTHSKVEAFSLANTEVQVRLATIETRLEAVGKDVTRLVGYILPKEAKR